MIWLKNCSFGIAQQALAAIVRKYQKTGQGPQALTLSLESENKIDNKIYLIFTWHSLYFVTFQFYIPR